MRRVIGMDIHRTFAEVVVWQAGQLRPAGRVDLTRAGLEGFGRTLNKEDEIVVEATGNAMAVVRSLEPYVARVIVANPLQVKAIAYAQVKPDKIDAGVLASLRAANFLPEIWLPDTDTKLIQILTEAVEFTQMPRDSGAFIVRRHLSFEPMATRSPKQVVRTARQSCASRVTAAR